MRILFLLWLGLSPWLVIAQHYDDTSVIVAPPVETDTMQDADTAQSNTLMGPYDISWITDTITGVKKDKKYRYMASLDSQLRHLNVSPMPDAVVVNPPATGFVANLFRWLLWLAAAVAVGYIVYMLFSGPNTPFKRNKKLTEITAAAAGDTAFGPSLIAQAQKAASQGNYRMAVRFQYLYLLQQMGEKNMLVLLPQKTNTQYLQEVQAQPYSTDFARLTLQYEYVWYGAFPLNAEAYQQMENGFRNFTEAWIG